MSNRAFRPGEINQHAASRDGFRRVIADPHAAWRADEFAGILADGGIALCFESGCETEIG
ncbi:hypothetical protein D3C83_16120 [compost metagenome]